MSKSMVEITIETAKYYAEDPEKRRGLKQHTQSAHDRNDPPTFMCVYYYENEIGEVVNCAIGRVLQEEIAIQMQHCSGSVCDLIAEYEEEEGYENDNATSLDSMLQVEYRGHPISFWEGLQSFHDGDQYWDYDKGGLSPFGLEHLNYMCENTLTNADREEVKNACLSLVKQ